MIMQFQKFKRIILLFSLLSTVWYGTYAAQLNDRHSNISVKSAQVHGAPKDYAIQASIDGHTLTVVFTENLGQVTVEVSRVGGGETQVESTPTPNGVLFYIYDTGSYIVTFTLPNGDEYYGEFEVTD